MIQDDLLEYNPQWEAVPWNPGIGPVKPNSQNAIPANQLNPYLLLSIDGPPGYSNMLAATHRPLLPVFDPKNIYYDFEFIITPGPDTSKVQVYESEVRYYYTDSKGVGYGPNNSLQINQVSPPGMIQAYHSPTDVWADTGIVIPLFKPNTPYTIKIEYRIDTVGHTMSTIAITISGRRYALPLKFQIIPFSAMPSPWAPGMYVQFQIGLGKAGGKVTTEYNQISVDWK